MYRKMEHHRLGNKRTCRVCWCGVLLLLAYLQVAVEAYNTV